MQTIFYIAATCVRTIVSPSSLRRHQHLLKTRRENSANTCRSYVKDCLHKLYSREPGYLSQYSNSLWAGRSRDRISVGAEFSAPVQTGSEAHPASCTMGIGCFLGVKRPGRGIDHPPHLAPRLKKELYFYSPAGPS